MCVAAVPAIFVACVAAASAIFVAAAAVAAGGVAGCSCRLLRWKTRHDAHK